MLNKIVKIFYLGNIITFLAIIILIQIFGNEINIEKSILNYLLFIIIIPIFDKIFDFIKKDSIFNFKFSTENFLKLFLCIFLASFMFFYKGLNIFEVLTIFSFFIGILFAIDERYYFLISLILLIFIPVEIILENKELAEKISIFLYYFLVIGVFISIFNQTLNKNLIEKQEKNLFFEKFKNKFQIENFTYISFLIFYITFIVLIYLGKFEILNYFVILYMFTYIFSKIFGFSIDFNKTKEEGLNIINWYIISIVLNIIILKFSIIKSIDEVLFYIFLLIILITYIIFFIVLS